MDLLVKAGYKIDILMSLRSHITNSQILESVPGMKQCLLERDKSSRRHSKKQAENKNSLFKTIIKPPRQNNSEALQKQVLC